MRIVWRSDLVARLVPGVLVNLTILRVALRLSGDQIAALKRAKRATDEEYAPRDIGEFQTARALHRRGLFMPIATPRGHYMHHRLTKRGALALHALERSSDGSGRGFL